jgi:hypothetical protein
MTGRKGELIGADLQRNWQHRVALPAEKMRPCGRHLKIKSQTGISFAC